MKKLGIVVPIYNTELYLRKCIESIINQTYKNIEVILVDDGSSDNSGKICEEYAQNDNRIRVIHQNNSGPVRARYNGVQALESDYVTFVDADDWIDEHAYEKMSVYMEHDEDVIMFQIIQYLDEKNKTYLPTRHKAGRYDKKKIEELIIPEMIWNEEEYDYGIAPSLCNKIIKRNKLAEELESVKNLNVHYGEDIAVVYPLFLKINSLVISEEFSYYHRYRTNGEVAPYFKDDSYYEKLFLLYTYLKKRMGSNNGISRQIDYFYNFSAGHRLRIYGDRRSNKRYMFPFDIIPSKSKIILYGAAEIGQLFYEQIQRLDYCIVTAWIDRNYSKYQDLGVKPVNTIEKIRDYDYVVIAVKGEGLAKHIIDNLTSANVDESKIVWSIR